jgi:acyl-CoA thioester hydrolase
MTKTLTFEPPAHAYVHRFCVQPSDIDELGHANNVAWLRWVNDVALAHATAVGWGPEACFAQRIAWVVRRHEIEYLLSALAGEEVDALTWPETVRGVTSLRRTLFRRDGRVLARAETTWVLVELPSAKPKRVPPDMLRAYGFAS